MIFKLGHQRRKQASTHKIDEQASAKEEPQPSPSRIEEARQLVEEYANDLREIIKKLRRPLH